ncbi:LytR/AlgR family response regulator transcription factor [Mangrovibacterium lignilyticum]|uniref:LytR/AlgR family response regulator transcription factor n=1 Tax=Mangrovibacterium lignilyticum TaxID=2668052 RepID=UPI0013D5BAF3|nr:LytTR family DNA-binding domain-containing protein [Mangrovibacterium lignilyticum]
MKKNNLKVLLVDDEQDARDILRYYLNDIPDIGPIEEASNAEEALFKYIDFNPDLVFLDIMMPGRNGDELIELLKKKDPNCHIIIVSAHKESAIMAIQNNIYDFILKPIDFGILIEKVEKYQFMMQSSIEEKFKKVLSMVDQGTKLKISSTNSHILIDPADILYCEADGSYSYLVMDNGTKELANTYLGKLEKILAEQRFFRVSRSILINLEKLSHVNKAENTCTLIGTDFDVEISGSKKQIKILCEMDLD